MRIFLDTSSLVKLYYNEPDSVALRAQINFQRDTLVVAELAWVEAWSALHTKVRQQVLTQADAAHRLQLLAADWPSFVHIPLATPLLNHAATLVAAHHALALRSLDAIQLAAALAAGPLDAFFTHDRHLHDAATAKGLPVR